MRHIQIKSQLQGLLLARPPRQVGVWDMLAQLLQVEVGRLLIKLRQWNLLAS